jgi:hypothetical protein
MKVNTREGSEDVGAEGRGGGVERDAIMVWIIGGQLWHICRQRSDISYVKAMERRRDGSS